MLPVTTDNLQFGADPDEEILNQAKEAGGELAAEDRESGGGMTCPVYAVIGNNSQDAAYTAMVNGRPGKANRAGTFKKIKDGETSFLDTDRIMPFAILSARTGRVCFEGAKTICRGISTNGRYDEVCISQNSPVREFGGKCSRCPMNRFNPDYRGDSAPINPRTNAPFEDNEWCKSSCDIYAAQIDPEDDTAPFELVKLQFSPLGFKRWTEFARKVENRGTKLWSFWSAFKAEEVANADSARSSSYLPLFAIGGALRPDQVEQAERIRTQFLDQLKNLLGTPPRDAEDASSARLVDEPAGNHALPAYTGQDAPGEPVGAAAASSGRGKSRKAAAPDQGDWEGPD